MAELEEWHKYLNDKTNSPEFGMEGESMMLSVDEDTKSDILSLIQRIRNNPKTRDNKLGKEISQKLLTSMFQNLHVCNRCYTTYQAGDKFWRNMCQQCQDIWRLPQFRMPQSSQRWQVLPILRNFDKSS